mgnify:CR=1 FL=1
MTSARFGPRLRVSGPIVRDRVMGSAAILRGVREGLSEISIIPIIRLAARTSRQHAASSASCSTAGPICLISADVTNQDPTPLTYAKVLAVKPGFQVDNPADLT